MQGKICKGKTNVAQDATKELWHKILGHLSEKGLKFLANDHFPNIKRQPLESLKIVLQVNNAECLSKD